MFLFPDDEMVDALPEYVLTNPEEVFGDQGGSTPRIEEYGGEHSLIVEEQRDVGNMKATKADLLIWAASFPVFKQKTSAKTAKNALAFLSTEVLEKEGGVMGKSPWADS